MAKFVRPNVSLYINGLQLSGEVRAPQELPKEVTAAPIEAWRIWYVRRPDAIDLGRQTLKEMADAFARGENPFVGCLEARLWSVGMESKWQAQEIAECLGPTGGYSHNRKLAPDRNCGCGIWGLKNENDLYEAMYHYGDCELAYGRVQLWGRWFEHARGYRAQYARPLEINVIGGESETVRELELFYGCPVHSVDPPEGLERLWQHGPTYSTAASMKAYSTAMVKATALPTVSYQQLWGAANQIFSGNVQVVSTNAPPTHGTPSSFLESSLEWTRRYGPDADLHDRDIAWQPGWFSLSGEVVDVTGFGSSISERLPGL